MTPAELRRLLDLAAKAMGYTTTHKWNAERMLLNPTVVALVVHRDGELVTTGWNPADDDGDSRRLEVMLNLQVNPEIKTDHGPAATAYDGGYGIATVQHNGDKYAATRLAVLRAASAIGEAMP